MKFMHRVFVLAEMAFEVPLESECPSEEELWTATAEQLERFARQMHAVGSCIHVRQGERTRLQGLLRAKDLVS